MVGCSQKSVAEMLKKHRLTGTVRDLAILGRPRVTTKRQDNLLVRKCKKDRFKIATQIKAEVLSEYSIKLSTSTVQRRLPGAGLFGRKPRRKPRLTTKHKRDRLSFTRSNKYWNTEEWARVVFSDESRFLLYTNDGRAYVRRMKGRSSQKGVFKNLQVWWRWHHGLGMLLLEWRRTLVESILEPQDKFLH
ncbi:Transposase domain containing protein [Oopsacas minuta]|uniref:Transposase domain containing protein n=1 Tax=Oopsacas minuta TaxID=111878 RepID=A0AAV7K4W8_9METZ|nr:Transposase domain containing protein [Oopsacas minuta]